MALGFGAQNLVRDFLAGMFMLLEDQYGVGDIVDLGSASGTVEAVGLRITTVRDGNGTVWYVRNGEILRVGNKSQGFASRSSTCPLAHSADMAQATEIADQVAEAVAEDPEVAAHLIEPPRCSGSRRSEPRASRCGSRPAQSRPAVRRAAGADHARWRRRSTEADLPRPPGVHPEVARAP